MKHRRRAEAAESGGRGGTRLHARTAAGTEIPRPAPLLVRDIMCTDVVSVEPENTLREAADILASTGFGGLPVVSSGRVIGVISGRDIVDFGASSPADRTASEEPAETEWLDPEERDEDGEPAAVYFLDLWQESGADLVERFAREAGEADVLDEHVVTEVMTRRLVTVGPDVTAAEAAGQMVGSGVHRLLVVKADRLLGIVTSTDLLRALSSEAIRRG